MTDRDPAAPGPLTRRRFLQGSALAGVAAFLAACTGTKPGGASAAPSVASSRHGSVRGGLGLRRARPSPRRRRSATGPLKFANWPAYIDLAGPTRRRRVRAGRLAVPRRVQEAVRRRGRLRGEDRRQRHVRRDDQAGPGRRPGDGLGPHGPDGLDGLEDRRQRLGREDRPRRTSRTAPPTSATP